MAAHTGMVLLLAATVAPPGRPDRRHPDAVAGEWIDLRHTTAADTTVWVLDPSGDDATLRIVVDPVKGRVEVRKHYGRWWLDGALADSVGRRLCFVHRPGRQGAACIAFAVDTVDGLVPRTRLTLHGYRGEHHTGDRELLARDALSKRVAVIRRGDGTGGPARSAPRSPPSRRTTREAGDR